MYGRSGCQNWDPQGAGKSHRTMSFFEILQKRVSKKTTTKKHRPSVYGRSGTQNWDPQGAGKSHRTISLFEILQKRVFKKITSFFDSHNATADPGCQNGTVPERAKSHRTISLFEIFTHVLAAQVPRGSIVTSVASGPHTPRPKDCPGLACPNTL